MKNEDQLVALIKEKINLEAEALLRIIEQVDGPYAEAGEAIMSCGGSVILSNSGSSTEILAMLKPLR